MILDNNNFVCCACSACVNICPNNALDLKQNNGIIEPIIDRSRCINCGLCNTVCPENKENKLNCDISLNDVQCFYCKSKDDNLRFSSSSGGIFPSLAKYIIELGGVVFAACFNNDYSYVEHIRIDRIDNIKKACGAKYVRSRLNDTFSQIKDLLLQQITVLFVGTPCQVNGLKRFLGKAYSSLYLIDMICHGVPDELYWKKYMNYINKNDKPIKSINFRDKRNGWIHYGISIFFQDGSSYFSAYNRDPYLLAFINNYTLSASCFDCVYRGTNRSSDITIGDAWGVDKVLPNINDDKGLSCVIINTNKGKTLFSQITNYIIKDAISYNDIVKYNPSVNKSVVKPNDYYQFIEDCQNMNTNSIIKKYFYISKITRVKDLIKSFKNKR